MSSFDSFTGDVPARVRNCNARLFDYGSLMNISTASRRRRRRDELLIIYLAFVEIQ